MILLEVFDIIKMFGEHLVFKIPELKIYEGDKIGIVGVNGAGKTTLMNILSGELALDSGTRKCYCDISYIRQFSEEKINADKKIMGEFSVLDKNNREKISGGEQARIKLANSLSVENALIFADEPTANLDFEGVELLCQKLLKKKTLVIISHDRALVDLVCNKIIEIKDGEIKIFDGNYGFYIEQNKAQLERSNFEYMQYKAEKSRLENAIMQTKTKAISVKKTPRRMGNSEARLHKREATESQERLNRSANTIKSRLKKLEVKEKPRETLKIAIDFSLTNPPQNKIIIKGENINFKYDNNIIFKNANFDIKNFKKTAIIGKNGIGKTTLFNLIREECASIYKVPKANLGFLHQNFENIYPYKTVLENSLIDCVQNQNMARLVLARLLFAGNDVYKRAEILSGGERIKLSLAKLLLSNANVLMLDEPTNYLDIASIEAVQELLIDYEGAVIFISHDKSFINNISDNLLIIKNKKIIVHNGNLISYENQYKNNKTLKNTDKLLLEIALTRVLSDISEGIGNKETLENEYQEILKKLKALA